MSSADKSYEQVTALAYHLAARRDAILESWRRTAEADPELTTASSLSRTQFYDHIPEVLDAFERKLRAQARTEEKKAEKQQKENTAGHGVHRWHHGYNQRAVMREWSHLHLCLVEELENYAAAHPGLEPSTMPAARRTLAELVDEGVTESITQYAALQQTDAAGRVRNLERALAEAKALESRRALFFREATHDLRNKLGVVYGTTAALRYEELSPQDRSEFLKMLQQGMESLRTLLDDLMSLARLDAGQEQRKIEPFDAAALLKKLCADSRNLAVERGLFLRTDGPPALPVEGDSVMTQRIAQNLVWNALKYTERGGVKVTWDMDERREHWLLCVQDTGPGFQGAPVAPLAHALKDATDAARSVEEKAEESGDPSAKTETAPTLPSKSAATPSPQPSGEGIGLSIVKRLCELLDASLELQTEPGKGSTFRVVFPRRYKTD